MKNRDESEPVDAEPRAANKPNAWRQRGRGRPRASQVRPSEDPAADIVSAAALLFAQYGYSGTTTDQIARKAGLRQSSLYYYFSNKSEILSALIYPLTRMQIEYLNKIRYVDRRAVCKLWRFIKFDIEKLSKAPVNVTEILLTATDADFSVFWKEREELTTGVAGLLRLGIAEDDLIEMDTETVAHSLICFSEGLQSWLRDQRLPQLNNRQENFSNTSTVVAFLADWLVRGLLATGTSQEQVRAEAESIQVDITLSQGK